MKFQERKLRYKFHIIFCNSTNFNIEIRIKSPYNTELEGKKK